MRFYWAFSRPLGPGGQRLGRSGDIVELMLYLLLLLTSIYECLPNGWTGSWHDPLTKELLGALLSGLAFIRCSRQLGSTLRLSRRVRQTRSELNSWSGILNGRIPHVAAQFNMLGDSLQRLFIIRRSRIHLRQVAGFAALAIRSILPWAVVWISAYVKQSTKPEWSEFTNQWQFN